MIKEVHGLQDCRWCFNHRAAAVRLFAFASLAILIWAGDSRGQAKVAHVGILSYGLTTDDAARRAMEVFRSKLAELGWAEGRQVTFEYRRAVGDPLQLAAGAAELTRLHVDVIFADSAPALRAARAATSVIPIVAVDFTSDPIAEGYIESYGRPGRNITGVFLDAPAFSGKWIELLKATVSGLSRIVVLWDPSPGSAHLLAIKEIARSSGVQLQVVEVFKPADIANAFAKLHGDPQAMIILPSPMIYLESKQLAKLTLQHRLLATIDSPKVVPSPMVQRRALSMNEVLPSWPRFLVAQRRRTFRSSGRPNSC